MGRRNHRGGKRQARRVPAGQPIPRGIRQPAVPIEKMTIPRGRCWHRSRKGKLIFKDEGEAKRALKQAQEKRKHQANGHVEVRYYQCAKKTEGGCGGWHLTSREEFHERSTA